MNLLRHSLTALLVTLASACQEDPVRAPAAGPCTGSACGRPGIVGSVPIGSGMATAGGSVGNAGANGVGGGGGASGAGTLQGSVVEWADESFVTTVAYNEPAQIRAEGSSGTSLVQARWNGVDPFELTGFRQAGTTWISVFPSSLSVLETLHPLSTALPSDVAFGLVASDMFDAIVQSLGVASARLPERGQVLFIFTGRNGNGLADVTVTSTDAEFIGYQERGVWSPGVEATDSAGLAVLLNLVTTEFPGVTRRVQLGGIASGFVEVRVASGAVSVVSVKLDR